MNDASSEHRNSTALAMSLGTAYVSQRILILEELEAGRIVFPNLLSKALGEHVPLGAPR